MNSRQLMAKQVTGLSGSGPQVGDFLELVSPPEDHRSDGGRLGMGEEILPSFAFQPIRRACAALAPEILDGSARGFADSKPGKSRSNCGSFKMLDPSTVINEKSRGTYGSFEMRDPSTVINEKSRGTCGSFEMHDPSTVINEKSRGTYGTASVAEIDCTVKKYADVLLNALESVSSRISQLEGRTHNLESAVDDLKLSIGHSSGSMDGKLRQLENILREVQSGVQVVRDKQDIHEAQMELAKLQVSKGDHQSLDDPNVAPSDPRQQPMPLPQQPLQQQAQPLAAPPSTPLQISALPAPPAPNALPPQPSPPQQLLPLPQQPLQQPAQLLAAPPSTPIQIPAFPPPPAPNAPPPPQPPPSQQNTTLTQFSSQVSQHQISSISPLPPHEQYFSQPGQLPADATQLHYQLPPQQSQLPPSQQYQSAPQIAQYSQPPQSQQTAVSPQFQSSLPHHLEESSPYLPPSQSYPPNIWQPPQLQTGTPPPPQQIYGSATNIYDPTTSRPPSGQHPFPSGYGPPSGSSFSDSYPYGGSPSSNSSARERSPFSSSPPSSGSTYPRLPTAQILPQPNGSNSGGSAGNRVPVDDVVDKVTTMGFPRELVRATVSKLTENGQSVDLNMVLDKLMNDGEGQQRKGWFGQ